MEEVPICDDSDVVVGHAKVSFGQISVGFDLNPIHGNQARVTLMRRQFEQPDSNPGASGGSVTLSQKGVRITPFGQHTYTIPLDSYNLLLEREGYAVLKVAEAQVNPDPVADRLASGPHWSVCFKPLDARSKGLDDRDILSTIIEVASDLTGWSYPNPDTRDGHYTVSHGKMASWTEGERREKWAFCDDGRFDHVFSLPEDHASHQRELSDKFKGGTPLPKDYLNVTLLIWVPTRVLHFLSRLIDRGFYKDGLEVAVSIRGVGGRGASFSDIDRWLTGRRVTSSSDASATVRLTPESVLDDYRGPAAEIASILLDQLGIEFGTVAIKSIQDKLRES